MKTTSVPTHRALPRLFTKALLLNLTVLAFGAVFAQAQEPKSVEKQLDEAGARIKAAVANGELTGDQAWAEWYAARDEILATAVASGELTETDAAAYRNEIHKAELEERLEAAGTRIKTAVASGELTEKDAWAEWYAAKAEIISAALEAGEISEDDAAVYRKEIHKAELEERLETAGERIKAAAAKGELTEKEAWAEWYATKQRLMAESLERGEITEADAAEFERAIHQAELKERISASGEWIKAAVDRGEMTEDAGWNQWTRDLERLVAEAADAGKISAEVAGQFRRGYEQWAVGQRLQTAVARGEMTEQESWAAWAEYREQAASEVAAKKDAPADKWARYVRAFIERYNLNEEQQGRAWDFYRDAREQDEASTRRLEKLRKDEDDPRAEARLQKAREAVERTHQRLFEHLKDGLSKLPTRAQRQAAEQIPSR